MGYGEYPSSPEEREEREIRRQQHFDQIHYGCSWTEWKEMMGYGEQKPVEEVDDE